MHKITLPRTYLDVPQCIYSLIFCIFHLTCVGAEVDDGGGQIVTFWREFRQLQLLHLLKMTLLQVFQNVNY